jgi:uncharacterized protein
MTRLVLFIATILALLAGIHYYIWARLIRDPHVPPPWNIVATVTLVLLGVGTPAVLILGRNHPGLKELLAWPAYIWMGTMFLLFVALLAGDLFRLVAAIGRKMSGTEAVDPDRRTFIARLTAVSTAVLAATLSGVALRSALGAIAVKEVRVRLNRLPKEQHGLTIAQLTDVHVGPTIGRAFIEEIVRRTNELAPDIVAITGDLVDGSVAELGDAVAPLANLKAKHGVFFVTGNHEYFSGATAWINELSRMGIRVLRNERVPIGAAEGAAGFDLAGIEDRTAGRYGGAAPEAAMATALTGRDNRRELVLLAHQPRSMFDAEPFGVGLQLSGHTHGGQIWPFGYLVRLQQGFLAGLHRRGDAQLYVSRGTGYWGPPMRLGAPAEITHIRLESAQA